MKSTAKTIEEKFDLINHYCLSKMIENDIGNKRCVNCEIYNICTSCGGKFQDVPKAIEIAYKLITKEDNMETKENISVRAEILRNAEKCIIGDRDEDYGTPEHSFSQIALLWSAYLHVSLTPKDVANMMVLFKVARTQTGHGKKDNWIDMAGYAACGGELENKNT